MLSRTAAAAGIATTTAAVGNNVAADADNLVGSRGRCTALVGAGAAAGGNLAGSRGRCTAVVAGAAAAVGSNLPGSTGRCSVVAGGCAAAGTKRKRCCC